MNTILIPSVGAECLITFDKFPNHSFVMKVIDTDVKDDSFGTIKYQTLEIRNKMTNSDHIEVVKPLDSFSVTEEAWFNEGLTGRKVEIINK